MEKPCRLHVQNKNEKLKMREAFGFYFYLFFSLPTTRVPLIDRETSSEYVQRSIAKMFALSLAPSALSSSESQFVRLKAWKSDGFV